jgi:hypothetical protein
MHLLPVRFSGLLECIWKQKMLLKQMNWRVCRLFPGIERARLKSQLTVTSTMAATAIDFCPTELRESAPAAQRRYGNDRGTLC